MVIKLGVQSPYTNNYGSLRFGKQDESIEEKAHDELMYDQKKKHPVMTGVKIQADKVRKAFTTYPAKGFKGSKNANFYEFLTMGMAPYLLGSGTMIAVSNLANKFFDTPAASSASVVGKKMGLGVVLYGVLKTLSKKLIETPVNLKYGIDVNLPYKKAIYELPDQDNKDNLVAFEYHKAYESVDFPRWDMLYDNESFGSDRNAYFTKVGKKMGLSDDDLKYADQKVKPLIKEKIIKTKASSTIASYLWAGVGVALAMQEPWDNLSKITKNTNIFIYAIDFCKKFGESCYELVNNTAKPLRNMGRALVGAALGMTLLGNFLTLFDFNKDKGSKVIGSTSIIDEGKEKVVC